MGWPRTASSRTSPPRRRIRVTPSVPIARNTDVRKARAALMKVMLRDKLVLHQPRTGRGGEQIPGGRRGTCGPPCHPVDYWEVYFGTLEEGKRALEEAGIRTPTPERKVHLYQH